MEATLKFDIIDVAIGIMYLRNEDLHSDTITTLIIDSNLTSLGYKGKTPERSVNQQLNSERELIIGGKYKSYFLLKDRDQSYNRKNIKAIVNILTLQKRISDLKAMNEIEFVIFGEKLVSVRNYGCLLKVKSENDVKITRIIVQDTL